MCCRGARLGVHARLRRGRAHRARASRTAPPAARGALRGVHRFVQTAASGVPLGVRAGRLAACARTALVAAHPWDTHGALRAGLLAGYVIRRHGEPPAVFDRPTIVADTLDGVVDGLLALG